jgi:hypothetical protein
MATGQEKKHRWALLGTTALGVVGAWATSLQLAVFALKDKPVRATVTHITNPLDQSTFGLDQLKAMGAAVWYGHGAKLVMFLELMC